MRALLSCAMLACGDARAVQTRAPPPAASLDVDAIREVIARVGDWQLSHPIPRDPRHWSIAPLYAGLIDASLVTGDPQYLAAVLRAGMRIDYELGSRTYHADGHAAGYAWLRIHLMDPTRDPQMLEPFVEQFDEVVDNPILYDLSFTRPPPSGVRRTDRWTWADALYMAPPTLAVLAEATGDDRYLEFMDAEYRFAYDALFDSEEGLFYRDGTYIGLRTPNDEKVLWARGNGWAYTGLALMLEELPADHPTRDFYARLFDRMSEALLATQQPDGFWYPSLLDPEQARIPEASATALFLRGMAWGIRRGLLDGEPTWPAVESGWDALLTIIQPDGEVVSVQPFGEQPELFDTSVSVPYGTGAVLLAGAEILRALGSGGDVAPAMLLEEAETLVPETPDLSTLCEWTCAW